MDEQHISTIVEKCVYRDTITNKGAQEQIADNFFEAETRLQAVNLIGFANGYVKGDRALDLRMFERNGLIDEPKIRKHLDAVVERMPSLHFMFVPLVLVREDTGISIVQLLRVRKPSKIPEQTVYVDNSLRLYDTFRKFLEDNRLPPGKLWYPTDGLIRFKSSGELCLSSCTITKRYTGMVKDALIAANIAATGLVLTPFAPVAAPILLIACSAPLIGISIAELVDSCKYERGTVIANRSAAMVLSLVTFSSVGLSVASTSSVLRSALSVEKLALLQKAESALNVTFEIASVVNDVYAVIGSVTGWQKLTPAEWVQLAIDLCFAYRKVINEENGTALFRKLQVDGVVQFFHNIKPNLAVAKARDKVEKWLETMLDVVFKFLQSKEVKFSVDDNFTRINLYGYTLEFETLLPLGKDAVLSLLQYLQRYIAPNRELNAKPSFTQETLNALTELLKAVYQLPQVSIKMKECIVVGNGHNISFDTLLAWWKAPANRKGILKEMMSLDECEAKQLNEIRATRLGAGGDAALFRWLKVPGAMENFITIAEMTGKEPIVFDDSDPELIVVHNLLSLSAQECTNVNSLEVLLKDTRFLQLCKDAENQSSRSNLVQRGKTAWLRTCRQSPQYLQLETVTLLEKLFTHPNTSSLPLTLAEALDYALDLEDATVGKIYYGILSAWHEREKEKRTAFDAAAMRAHFNQLICDAEKLNMNRSMMLQAGNRLPTIQEDDENASLIAIVRQGTRSIHYGENLTMHELYFHTKERGACFLNLFPALRHKAGRDQFNRNLRYLLKKGDAQVLLGERSCAKHIQFYRGKMMVVFEMLPVYNNMWSVSVQLCSLAFRSQSNPQS